MTRKRAYAPKLTRTSSEEDENVERRVQARLDAELRSIISNFESRIVNNRASMEGDGGLESSSAPRQRYTPQPAPQSWNFIPASWMRPRCLQPPFMIPTGTGWESNTNTTGAPEIFYIPLSTSPTGENPRYHPVQVSNGLIQLVPVPTTTRPARTTAGYWSRPDRRSTRAAQPRNSTRPERTGHESETDSGDSQDDNIVG